MRPWAKLGLLCSLFILLGGTGSVLVTGNQGVPADSYQPLQDATQSTINQISQAISHTLFAWSALDRGDADGAKTHAHHVLNIIEGPQGPDYDASYGGSDQGIGDGVGALIHAQHLLDLLNQSPPSNGGDYVIAAQNVVFFLQTAIPHVLNALTALKNGQSAAVAVPELRQAQGLLMAARGSQEEKNRPTEGGARTILAWLAGL